MGEKDLDPNKSMPVFFIPSPLSKTPSSCSNFLYGDGEQDEEGNSFSFSQFPDQDLFQDQGYTADQSFSSSQPSSPQMLRTPARRALLPQTAPHTLLQPLHSSHPQNQNLYTPPQKSRYAEKMKVLEGRGSLSEPPPKTKISSRARVGLNGKGTKLFDISEDLDYGAGCRTEFDEGNSLLAGRDGEIGFSPYPYLNQHGYQQQREDAFYSPAQPRPVLGVGFGQGVGLNDPFSPLPLPVVGGLNTIKEREVAVCPYSYPYPNPLPLSSPYSLPIAATKPKPAAATTNIDRSACSVCGRSNSKGGFPKAVLIPCSHPLCSACLTSALNIVGEKDMECSVCKSAVRDFKLVGGKEFVASSKESKEEDREEKEGKRGTNEVNAEGERNEEGAENEGSFEFFQDVMARSSPPPAVKAASDIPENAVLRIDNVPWDITPPQIRTFFNSPSLTNVYILLDQRGKTLSHAFVEFNNEEAAKAALRGTQKNAVLGKGKRTRGVTVTRGNQEELMRCLFPSWKGSFDGCRPSLSGLPNNPSVITTLETGLITSAELSSLLHLIRSPGSRFLKLPSLPFYSLVSILRKFPVDCDSRVFWGREVRDGLFNVLVGALRVLLGRIGDGGEGSDEEELVKEVFEAGMHCDAFIAQQKSELTSIIDNTPYSYGSSPLSSSDSPPSSPLLHLRTPETHRHHHPQAQAQTRRHPSMNMNGNGYETGHGEPFGVLAREFGLDAQLVQALAHRLAAF